MLNANLNLNPVSRPDGQLQSFVSLRILQPCFNHVQDVVFYPSAHLRPEFGFVGVTPIDEYSTSVFVNVDKVGVNPDFGVIRSRDVSGGRQVQVQLGSDDTFANIQKLRRVQLEILNASSQRHVSWQNLFRGSYKSSKIELEDQSDQIFRSYANLTLCYP